MYIIFTNEYLVIVIWNGSNDLVSLWIIRIWYVSMFKLYYKTRMHLLCEYNSSFCSFWMHTQHKSLFYIYFSPKCIRSTKKILSFLKKMILLNIFNRKQLMSSKTPLTSTWWKHLSNSTCIQRTFIWKIVMIHIEHNQHEIYLEWKPNPQVDWVIFVALVSPVQFGWNLLW